MFRFISLIEINIFNILPIFKIAGLLALHLFNCDVNCLFVRVNCGCTAKNNSKKSLSVELQ